MDNLEFWYFTAGAGVVKIASLKNESNTSSSVV
jgi:hypothetical protein